MLGAVTSQSVELAALTRGEVASLLGEVKVVKQDVLQHHVSGEAWELQHLHIKRYLEFNQEG